MKENRSTIFSVLQKKHEISFSQEELFDFILDINYKINCDFSRYEQTSFRRRVIAFMSKMHLQTLYELRESILSEKIPAETFLEGIAVHVTEMFRHPETFLLFRKKIISQLKNLSKIKIWHAGCSTGEEVYSTAICLHEHGLLERSEITATDLSPETIFKAKQGIVSDERMSAYATNYALAGGEKKFEYYFSGENGENNIQPYLKENVNFARHNLVMEKGKDLYHIIFCCNVMIYFDPRLQNKAVQTFAECLAPQGLLITGRDETIAFNNHRQKFRTTEYSQNIFQRIN